MKQKRRQTRKQLRKRRSARQQQKRDRRRMRNIVPTMQRSLLSQLRESWIHLMTKLNLKRKSKRSSKLWIICGIYITLGNVFDQLFECRISTHDSNVAF